MLPTPPIAIKTPLHHILFAIVLLCTCLFFMHAMQVSPSQGCTVSWYSKEGLPPDHGLSSWLFLDTLPNLPRAPHERGIVPDTHTHIHTQRDTHTYLYLSIYIYIYIYRIYIYILFTFKKDPEYVHKLKHIYI